MYKVMHVAEQEKMQLIGGKKWFKSARLSDFQTFIKVFQRIRYF